MAKLVPNRTPYYASDDTKSASAAALDKGIEGADGMTDKFMIAVGGFSNYYSFPELSSKQLYYDNHNYPHVRSEFLEAPVMGGKDKFGRMLLAVRYERILKGKNEGEIHVALFFEYDKFNWRVTPGFDFEDATGNVPESALRQLGRLLQGLPPMPEICPFNYRLACCKKEENRHALAHTA